MPFLVYFWLPTPTKDTKNDMGNYTTNTLRVGSEVEPARKLTALGGVFDCRWNDTAPLTTSAHNALMSAFLAAGGVFDRLVGTCPLKLTSNNAPTNRETLGTLIVGMLNGSYRYRHFDGLGGDAVTAEMFGLDRLLKWLSGRLRPRLGGDGSHQEAVTTRRRLQQCVARVSRHGRRATATIFTAGKGHAGRVFAQMSGVLEMVSAASQLKVEERWQLLVYYAFRKYQLVHRMYPPLVDGQILLPLA